LFEEALLELPVRARTVWALSHVDGWTCQQIAEHLNVSRNTVYNDVKLVIGHCRDALARLERDGEVVRLARGLYQLPVRSSMPTTVWQRLPNVSRKPLSVLFRPSLSTA
jgi:predicted transcriptional regulator of viral defense system